MQFRVVNRGAKSKEITLPAPIKGLNKKDPMSAMDALYAIEMDNYIPLDGKVELRPGYKIHTTFSGLEKVKTLAAYRYPNEDRFFAFYDGKMFDITSPLSPIDKEISLSTSYCQTVQYKNYLYILNGLDTPKAFYVDANGDEHLSDWGFSGGNLQATRIVTGGVSKEFLWFVEKDSLRVWYAGTAGSVSGTLYAFDLSGVSKWGGAILAVANWTVDGGTGIDDLTVFITSEGEVLVYAGTNPNNASNWILKGSYKISKPIGYRCVLAYQGDMVIICQDGYFPLAKALAAANAGDSLLAFSDKIRGLVIDRTSKNKNKEGWQAIIYNKKGYGIFNVPTAEQFEQHVINISTGAWCRFTNINAYCWCVFDDCIYFGSTGAVYRFDDGYDDNGMEITGAVEQAFCDMGIPNLKRFSLLNPRTASSMAYDLAIYTNTDYKKRNVSYTVCVGKASGTKWNRCLWSASQDLVGTHWSVSQAEKINSEWIMNSSLGVKASVVFKTKTKGIAVDWYETGVRYELGTGIV